MVPDMKSVDNIYLVLGFLVPGLIMTWVRAQFTTGRISLPKEALLVYLAQSVAYYAFVLPAVEFVVERSPGYGRAAGWILLVFAGPAILGLALGLNARHGFARSLLGRLKLPVIHVMPTAWDWKFAANRSHWVLVTLKDGTRFAGIFGAASFASSDPAERDLYLEKVYDLDDDDNWIDRGEKGALLVAGEIRSVEFLPDTKGTENVE